MVLEAFILILIQLKYLLFLTFKQAFLFFFFFFSVLVSEPTSQVKKIRKKDDVRLSNRPVKPVWAS